MNRHAAYGGLSEMAAYSTLSQSNSLGSILSTDSLLSTPTKTPFRNRQCQYTDEKMKGAGHEKMGSMDTIDQLELDLGQPWSSRIGG